MEKRSGSIEIAFVSMVAAAALSGCNAQDAYHRDWQQCVDKNNLVVADSLCDRPQGTSSAGSSYYHWLYSPRPYYPGAFISDGYLTPRPNMGVTRASGAAFGGDTAAGITRGGFGSSAHGAGVGE
jgi:hypothetical protein